ncbi:D-2-hydroxyacid dehydrogenase [Candidatus Kryptobacter tengchongensis]|uniref:Phosphoglycerate dehydrogenase n=1 Tax=Kryptobacter tengchongensis TaxID=1643429 RepID=A0A916LJI3_KRYT1|nr:D-2-hydroxyacid dehydrogenase [Candidatus Kryptobacter tengchongensis]CUS98112.1 Phosphoglycerate dehydrogenase [Candidatus Kryptobacter tengchongensis]
MKRKVIITHKIRPSLVEKIISQIGDKADIVFDPDKKEIDKVIEDVEIIFGDFERNHARLAKNLRWVHLGYAGVDMILYPEIVNSDVIVTCSKGIHQHHMTEFLFGMILTLTRRFDKIYNVQKLKIWDKQVAKEFVSLRGKTMGILGLGNIGRQIAKVSKAFEMYVIGMKRTKANVEYVDEVITKEEMQYLLENSDFIVVVLPLTEETFHLIGEREFEMMSKKPYFFNIGRGAVVDEKALIDALKNGKIRGAGLDVFENEPLPKDSPLWEMENVLITPHIAGLFPNYWEEPVNLFIENFKRYIDGKNLMNVVDKVVGY